MKTAVEFIESEVKMSDGVLTKGHLLSIIEQAKEMEEKKKLTITNYNLDELAMDYASTIYDGRTQLNKFQGAKVDFKKGFQKALELLTFKL